MYDEASMIASEISRVYQGKKQDMQTAYPQLQAVAAYLHSEIWVVDRQGMIIMDSADESKAGKNIENFDPAATGSSQYCKGDYFGEFSYDVVSVSAPITGNYNTYGYVVMHLPMTVIRNSVYRKLNVYYISALVIFVLSLTILLVFTGIVYVPLMRITEGAKEYADGNLAYRIEVDTQDEMGYLAATLNYMSDELNQLEEYQRTFVANVSHDFRSPLTSIKGYLEAIIDGTIPQELQEKYLKRVIAETERLNKLTQGMLTLDSIEKKGLLNRSNFDINRVIKDTAASFEGTCMKKGITFDLTFSDNTQMVYADLGKIQQVLYNLIDNAIKFSNHDSRIYIQTYVHYEKIYVSVKDTGIGIPKSSIKKIWERFYKTDLSRGKDKKGTGLGLAIVREIIQAHEENIDVISTEGVGTEFIFTLPKASKEG
jgi:signal transduction histidine kinase